MNSTADRISAALLLVIALVSLSARFALIEEALPYCHHGDEMLWSTRANKILQSGDLNPHRFTKPGAHIYFMTAGLALGFVRASANLDVKDIEELGTKVCTTFPVPEAIQVAKNMYALVSVLAMVLAGILARRLSGIPATLFLAPLFICASSSYFLYSWSYMNTNVLGGFAILATIAYPLCAREGVSSQRKALLVGALAGLTIATKYNLFLILLPACLYFILYHRDRWLSHCLLVVGVAILSFFAITPYALLDVHAFVRDVGAEAYHYAYGHMDLSKHTFEPGWPMFQQYYAVLRESFGGLVIALSLVGMLRLLVQDWKAGVVVFSFPIVFLAYMSDQKTFFARNVVSLHLFVGLGAAVGFCFLVQAARDRLAQRERFRTRPQIAGIAAAGVASLIVLAALPWAGIVGAYESNPEPRNLATAWVHENAKPWHVLLIDRRLGLDVPSLRKAGFKIKLIEPMAGEDSLEELRARYGSTLMLYPKFRSAAQAALFEGVTPLAEFTGRSAPAAGIICGRRAPTVKIGRL